MFRHGKILFLVILFLALQFILLSRANAEYRVYLLGVQYDDQTGEQQVTTTLDDQQFETYYKITPTQKTRIIDHWMCWGRTDNFTPYCDRPIRPASKQATAQNQAPPQPAQGPISAPPAN